MRSLMLVLCCILLIDSACAKTNYYPQTIHSWKGGDASLIIKRWGKPDRKLVSSNGSTILIYETKSYPFSAGPMSPQVGVSARADGGAVITTTPNTNYSWSRGGSSPNCVTVFEIDSKGKVLNSQSKGPCYGNENFFQNRGNPELP